jgi:hypothetical protein
MIKDRGRRRQAGASDKRAQLGPSKVGVDPAAEAAIRGGNDVFAADDRRVAQDAVGDELRMLDKVGGMADDTWHQHVARRQLRLLPHAPLMLVPHVARLEGIGLRLHLEDQVDDGSSGRSRVCGSCQQPQHTW